VPLLVACPYCGLAGAEVGRTCKGCGAGVTLPRGGDDKSRASCVEPFPGYAPAVEPGDTLADGPSPIRYMPPEDDGSERVNSKWSDGIERAPGALSDLEPPANVTLGGGAPGDVFADRRFRFFALLVLAFLVAIVAGVFFADRPPLR
jgi:hypothetical protein